MFLTISQFSESRLSSIHQQFLLLSIHKNIFNHGSGGTGEVRPSDVYNQ